MFHINVNVIGFVVRSIACCSLCVIPCVFAAGVDRRRRPAGQEAADCQAGGLGAQQQRAAHGRRDVHHRRGVPQGHRHRRRARLA